MCLVPCIYLSELDSTPFEYGLSCQDKENSQMTHNLYQIGTPNGHIDPGSVYSSHLDQAD